MHPANRLEGIDISIIRQIHALGTPFSVNLGIGEPNLEPDDTLRDMARRAAILPWRYSANAGNLPLRKLIGGQTGYDPKDEVCVTAGTEEALYSVFQAYVNPGDEVLVPNPGFVTYATLARLCGATPVAYDLQPPEWRVEPSALRFSRKTKLVVINSPSNPLGSIIDEGRLRQVVAAAEEHRALVVSDEVYREIWYEEAPPSIAGLSPNAIVVNGMSKSHGMTGLRIGWICAKADLMKPIVTAHQYIATCASVFSQALAEMVLSDSAWNTAWLEGVRAQFRTQREVAVDAIARELDVKVEPPAGAFYAFAPVPACDTLSFARAAAEDAAVLVVPGMAFGSNGEGFIRISFAASLDQIGTGIERLGRWLRASGR